MRRRRSHKKFPEYTKEPVSEGDVDLNRAFKEGEQKRLGNASPHEKPVWVMNCKRTAAEDCIKKLQANKKFCQHIIGLPKGTPPVVDELLKADVVGVYETHPGVDGNAEYDEAVRSFTELLESKSKFKNKFKKGSPNVKKFH